MAGRVAVAWGSEIASYRASAAVKAELRRRFLARAVELGPRWLAGRRSAELTALATEGIEALDGYFSKYLPQLILAAIVPVAVLVRVGLADPVAGLTIAATLPLVPVFGALVGKMTGAYAEQRWRALAVLSHHFLDVVSGLPTLKVFGRSKEQQALIGRVTGDYRQATMGTLRVAFLSSLVLELVATMSVALVAVEVGLSLVYGHLGLRTGLLALILAPEAYLPLRQAAAQFHASADGLAAADAAIEVIETPAPPTGERPAPAPRAIRAERSASSTRAGPPGPGRLFRALASGRDRRARRPQRVGEIHAGRRAARLRPAVGRPGPHRRRRPGRPGRRNLAGTGGLGSAAAIPVPRHGPSTSSMLSSGGRG